MVKTCCGCGQSLPRDAFSLKQWSNAGSRPPRRCTACIGSGSSAGLLVEPADVAAAVAATSERAGGAVGAAFPAAWAEAHAEVQQVNLGAICAAMMRNLGEAGASKEEKAAHRALLQEAWRALGGQSAREPRARAPAAVDAAAWAGVAGLLASTDGARGRKPLAATELAAAVRQHHPALALGADVASVPSLVFLPCADRGPGGAVAAEAALAAIRARADPFAHVHRLWAVREVTIIA
jgi:hypothetical protein